MPRKRRKPIPKMSGRTLVLTRDKQPTHWRSTAVLVLLALILLGLVSWAVYSDANEWNDWLGGLRAKSSSPGTYSQGKESDSPAHFKGDGYADLGEFSVDRREHDDSILTVKFKLSGKTNCQDEEAFQAFADNDYAAFHKYAEGAVRDCPFSALSDEKSLGRKVVTRVNRSLGRHFLQTVKFDELTIYETIDPYEATIWKPEGQSE